jgi:MraZ protein
VTTLNLIGEYNCRLDPKSRILFPAGLKKQLSGEDVERFVINRGFESCLVVYPYREWEKIAAEINQLNLYVKKNREFVRYFYRGATEVALDGSTRLLIPRQLLSYAGITKDVVLFAFSNRIEMWDKDRYEGMLGVEPEDFSDLAEDVMSRKDRGAPEDVS